MFCPNCGSSNSNDSVFCQNCGTPLNQSVPEKNEAPAAEPASAQTQYQTAPEPQYQQPAPQPAYQTGGYGTVAPQVNPVVAKIKELGSSAAFLVGIIAQTLAALFILISSFASGGRYMNVGGYRVSIGDYYNTGSTVLGVIIMLIPSLLIIIGLWLTYATSRKKNEPFKTAGLTMIKVITIIEFVAFCVLMGLVIIALIAGASFLPNFLEQFGSSSLYGSGYYGYNYGYDYYNAASSIATGVMVFLVLILIAVSVLMIFFYAKTVKTINTAKRSASTGVASDRVSPFVAVMLFIAGGFLAIYTFILWAAGAILLGFVLSFEAVAMFTFGVLIFKYRTAMRALMASNNQFGYQPYGGQPQGGAPYYQQQSVSGVTCPRCHGVYASNLSNCPYCGLPKQNF